jgi:HK97 family phage portal protein
MIDALDKAFADADRMVTCAKAAGGVTGLVQASAGYNNRPLSLMLAQEQMLHFRGWVWSAVRLVAQRIAGQVVCAGKRATGRRYKSIGENIEPLESHPLLEILADPNDWQTYWQLMFVSVASLEITGRALWWVSKDSRETANGLGTSILHIPSEWIVKINALQTEWTIRPTTSTEEFVLSGDELLHLHYPDPSDPRGVISPLSRVAEAVLTDQQIQTAQHSAFKNGIFPKVVLTAGKLPSQAPGMEGMRPTLTPQQRADLVAAIKGAYRGVINADEPIILDSLIEKIEKFSQTILEMDFIGSSKVTKARVLQAYGVSPILLGELENANRASSTVAEEIFVYNKVNPLIELISGVMTQWLAPMFAGPRERLVVWIEPAQPHDAENTLKQWDLGLRTGSATRNEYRTRVLNLQPLDGLDVPLEPIGFLPAQQSDDDDSDNKPDDDSDNKPKKRLNGNCNRITITAAN